MAIYIALPVLVVATIIVASWKLSKSGLARKRNPKVVGKLNLCSEVKPFKSSQM